MSARPTEPPPSAPLAESAPLSRTERSRQAILQAATEVFQQHGYVGATTDEVAARAAVSKQTLYRQFADKEHLFAEMIIESVASLADDLAHATATALQGRQDVLEALREFARGYLASLLQPEFVRLRRLVIGEADRFPEIAGVWFDRGFERALGALGEALHQLAEGGQLHRVDDPRLAAYQLAALIMYEPMNQVMFAGTAAIPAPDRLNRIADAAVDVFLAYYG